MASATTIDLDAILKPIPGDHPGGRDAKNGKDFDLLKEARREDDALNQGDWKREAKVADWPKAIQIATKILTTESKDLQVAAWLTEALLKRHGIAGLRDGLKVMHGLHAMFWESMYPPIEEGDLEYRSGKLDALNKLLPYAINSVPLLRASDGSSYGYAHYKESQDTENLRRAAASNPEKQRQLEDAIQEGKLDGERFEKAVTGTPLAHCTVLLEHLTESWNAYEQLDKVLEEKYGENAPSLRLVKEAIAECRDLMDTVVKKKGGVGLSSAENKLKTGESMVNPLDFTSAASSGLSENGALQNRAEALRRLASVAEFFRKTEPHSPVSYLVQRAARWGQMPLEQWLQEVIKDDGVLKMVKETLGIKENSSDG